MQSPLTVLILLLIFWGTTRCRDFLYFKGVSVEMVCSGSNPVIVHLKSQSQRSSWVNSLNIQTVLLSIQTFCGLGVYADVCDAAVELMYLMNASALKGIFRCKFNPWSNTL